MNLSMFPKKTHKTSLSKSAIISIMLIRFLVHPLLTCEYFSQSNMTGHHYIVMLLLQ